MKAVYSALILMPLVAFLPTMADQANPIQKVLEMISDLESKVIAEGKVAQKEYEEYAEWCDDTSRNLNYEIKTGKAMQAELEATIQKQTAIIETEDTKIAELAASIASDEKDLKEATEIRKTEAADFAIEKREQTVVINELERGIGVLGKEMDKGSASMLQLHRVNTVTQALNAMVQASFFSAADASKLTALVQSKQESDDSDDDTELRALGAPASSTYSSHGGGILDTLDSVLGKAQDQMDAASKKEENAIHNFALLEQSLTDEIRFENKAMDTAKKNKMESAETKSVAEGDLAVTKADLAQDIKSLADLHTECMMHANDFEAATKSRGEELKALATARKVVAEASGGAQAISYGLSQLSFVQTESSMRISTRADLTSFEVVRIVRDLAQKQNSKALAQLASRLNSAVKLGSSESDVFAKVKGLVSDMIARLEKEAASDATEKEYCDKETSETTAKKEENQAEIDKLSTKIEQAAARSAKLKDEVATLQKELADLARSQAEMDKLRSEEKATFVANEADLKKGVSGIQLALKVLKEYYSKTSAHGSAEGSSGGIISLLEVAESDFSKDLAQLSTIERTAEEQYEAQTKENEITRTTKSQDEKYKQSEFTSLDKKVGELSLDREGVQAEQDAVLQYLAKINQRCIAKAESYAERKAKREAEIAGLQDALQILEDETALIQKASRRILHTESAH